MFYPNQPHSSSPFGALVAWMIGIAVIAVVLQTLVAWLQAMAPWIWLAVLVVTAVALWNRRRDYW